MARDSAAYSPHATSGRGLRWSATAVGGTGVLLSTMPDRLDSAFAAVRAEIEAMDLACNRFRADSELSRVNSNAGRFVPVSGLFAEAVDVALRAARLTDGALEPTCAAAAPPPGWQSIEWDPREQQIRITPGSLLDFSATAKALAVDRAAYAAHRAAGCGVLVRLGGDFAVHGQAPDGGWPARVTSDRHGCNRHECDHRDGSHNGAGERAAADGPEAPGQSVILTEGGLATWTSSTAQRRCRLDGSIPSCWRTVSVTAITCVDAKIAATAAIIRGESAIRWLTGLGLPARLVHNDGSVLILADWPAAANRQTGPEPV